MYRNHNRSTLFLQTGTENKITARELKNLVFQSIVKNATRVDLYNRLLNDAPNRFTAILLENIRLNEIDLLNRFEDFYIENFGPIPAFQVNPIIYSSYKEGIEEALLSEVQSVQLARKIREAIPQSQPIYDLYRSASEIDFDHQDLLGTIYNQLD